MKEILMQLAAPQARVNGITNNESAISGGTGGLANGTLEGTITQVINVIMWVIGVISVIMLIYGGIQYAISAGDEKKVTSAKNTIIYAIVGLAIAILALVVVNFVIVNIGS
ncbi:pilin [Candidatus Saccharibacteria bacterium]|nr:pilin [Candidatus Saccharibacteria bacterium]